MWRLGFLFHEITFGLLSVFLPLYIIRIGGTLLDIGIMTSVAMFAAITDPILVFERGLVSIEKSVEFTYKGVTIASKILEGFRVRVDLKMENLYAFFGGLTLFSLATSTLFTPLPVFFSQDLRFPPSMVFTVYVSNSAANAIRYFLISARPEQGEEKVRLQKIVLVRSFLAFFLAVVAAFPVHTTALAFLILTLMGFAYAIYHACVLSLSMELISAGKAGLFDVLVSIGGATGAFIGPFIAQTWGFIYVFLLVGAIFLLAFILFKVYS